MFFISRGVIPDFIPCDAGGSDEICLRREVRLAEMLGGAVSFCSTPGEGSTFTLTIAASPAATPRPVERESDDLLTGLKVLVVEDNPINQMLLEKFLTDMNCQVVTLENGLEAVRHLDADRGFDVILMDVNMPEMDGYQATRRIRDAEITVPVIGVSAGRNFIYTHYQNKNFSLGASRREMSLSAT